MDIHLLPKINEKNTKHAKRISIKKVLSFSESICKIMIITQNNNLKEKIFKGTGFFINIHINQDYIFLVTSTHVLDEHFFFFDKIFEIITESGISQKFDKKSSRGRLIKNINGILAYQIIDEDEIRPKIHYFSCVNNEKGYDNYYEKDVYILQFPGPKCLEYASGKIMDKKTLKNRECEFAHTVDTDKGSIGAPIILFEKQKVIGVHNGGLIEDNSHYKIGAFIGELHEVLVNKIKQFQPINIKFIVMDDLNQRESTIEIDTENFSGKEKDYDINETIKIKVGKRGLFRHIDILNNS